MEALKIMTDLTYTFNFTLSPNPTETTVKRFCLRHKPTKMRRMRVGTRVWHLEAGKQMVGWQLHSKQKKTIAQAGCGEEAAAQLRPQTPQKAQGGRGRERNKVGSCFKIRNARALGPLPTPAEDWGLFSREGKTRSLEMANGRWVEDRGTFPKSGNEVTVYTVIATCLPKPPFPACLPESWQPCFAL